MPPTSIFEPGSSSVRHGEPKHDLMLAGLNQQWQLGHDYVIRNIRTFKP